MYRSHLLRWLRLTPLYDAPDAGSGSGAGGTGAGTGAGAGTSTGTGAGTGTGGAAPYKLTDDSLVDFGDGQPIKWGEARESRYIPKERFDRGVEYLTTEARKLEAEWAKYYKGEGPRPKPTQQSDIPDPMAEVRGLPVVGGGELDKVVRALYQNGFAPLAQAVAALGSENAQLKQAFQRLSGHTGSLVEGRQQAEFEDDVSKAIASVGEIKGLGALDAKSEIVREIAKDVFLSHEQQSWRPGEFGKMLKARVEMLFGLFKQMQKTEVDAAKQRRSAVFLNPQRGNASGQGEPKYQHKTGRDLAAALFGTQPEST